MKLLGITSADFDVVNQLLIRFSSFIRYWRKKWEYNGIVLPLFIDLQKVCDSVRREICYDVLTELCTPMKIVRQIMTCLNETYSQMCIANTLPDALPIRNDLKPGDALSPFLFNFALDYAIKEIQGNHERLEVHGKRQLLVYSDGINIFGENINAMEKNT
jgi:hypothetical protein